MLLPACSGLGGLTVSSEGEDSPDLGPPTRPRRSMHTGQSSIAPESSLPQLGQVRWGSVLMTLTALQPQPGPKATPRSAQWCQIGKHGPWQTVVPVPQANASSFRVALQITFRNKIPIVGVLRLPVLIMSFGDGAARN